MKKLLLIIALLTTVNHARTSKRICDLNIKLIQNSMHDGVDSAKEGMYVIAKLQFKQALKVIPEGRRACKYYKKKSGKIFDTIEENIKNMVAVVETGIK